MNGLVTGESVGQQGRGSEVDGRWRRLVPRGTDRDALGIWLLSRLSLVVVVSASGWLFANGDHADDVVGWLDRWAQWDFHHFAGIARYGYGGEPTGVPNEAFFPGLPALLRLGAAIGLPHVLTGLLVSLIAGGVAAVALARLGELEGGARVGRLAVLFWVTAPPAVFLAAPYTESLFLACALPAWLAARRGRWSTAGVLVAMACTVRVSGVFLAAAVGVHWLVTRRSERSWAGVGWLLLPLVPLAGWMFYLYRLTGNWLAWLDAQAQEWNRVFTWPWDAFAHTWRAAFGGTQSPGFAWMFGAELVALGVGVALTAALLWWRRWGEATWIGLQVAAFATSYWFFSVPRASLLWWPAWIALAMVAAQRRWVLWLYLSVSAPLMVVWTVTYATGGWAG